MPDFAGGMLTPFLAAFDPDGEKTDELFGKKKKKRAPGGGGDVGDPNDEPEPGEGGGDLGQAHDDAGEPDSGGYWEYPYFGGPAIWHPASFSHGYKGGPNLDTFNPDNGNPPPGGGDPHGAGGDAGDPYAR